jgi:hypothetical protein
MQVFGKTAFGKTYTINIKPDDNMETLYKLFSEKIGIPVNVISLIYAGHVMENSTDNISKYKIRDCSTVHIVCIMKGD